MTSKPPLINQLLQRADIQCNTKDNSWDYLNELSLSWQQSLAGITDVVTKAFHFLDFANAYVGEARVLVEGLQTELLTHATKWRALSDAHKHKRGLGRGSEEHSVILNTALDYVQSHEEFMNACSFSAPRLQELVTEHEYRLRAYVETQETAGAPSHLPSVSLNTNI